MVTHRPFFLSNGSAAAETSHLFFETLNQSSQSPGVRCFFEEKKKFVEVITFHEKEKAVLKLHIDILIGVHSISCDASTKIF